MHLKSITLKGFKSFPDRTELSFVPGVSVIVGPNGSGKSNITDAVLWALGEQSPLAVRGQTMQDVIFAGGHGVKGRNAAEVEIVMDNADGLLHSDFAEISISRRVDRSGEGIYRLNGARCRLVDVLEVLSDSGLGKEMHSVISQGRVDAIVNSKPVDRTALIEEAAGLSKHRKRRHRAQLKLTRTQDNLDRALDVEREARSRLRPLKRQAEAAELHARLERQSLELRGRLAQESLRLARVELEGAQRSASDARRKRDGLETDQATVARQREQAERGLAEHGHEREALSSRLFSMRSAADRISLRLESVKATTAALSSRRERTERALTEPAPEAGAGGVGRLAELEAELARLERDRDARLAAELEGIERERGEAAERAAALGGEADVRAAELERAERAVGEAQATRETAERSAQEVATAMAVLEVELERALARQRPAGAGAGPSLAESFDVEDGFEAAVAAALSEGLDATVVEDVAEGARAVRSTPEPGGRAVVRRGAAPRQGSAPPVPGAERLLERVRTRPDARDVIEPLLSDAWLVARIEDVPNDFEGIAVTRDGVAYHGALRQVRSMRAGAHDGLAARNRREEIERELHAVRSRLELARQDAANAALALSSAQEDRDRLEREQRELRSERERSLESERKAAWVIEQRRELGSGPDDLRRRELTAEILAERKLAESAARERAEQVARRRRLQVSLGRDGALLPTAESLAAALEAVLASARERVAGFERALEADEQVGERAAAELRRLAREEYDLQARLREASELLTQEEVRAAQVRDREQAIAAELEQLERRLSAESEPQEPLADEERLEIEARLERLERRRERIGPVNPLAESEYEEAIAHVEELEGQRKDLEQALVELRGLIRETDRRIRESFEETFEIAARNFEEVVQQLFPGGRGRLRLVKPQQPRGVLGGESAEPGEADHGSPFAGGEPGAAPAGPPAAPEPELEDEEPKDETPGIEIEVTPAGKATKRLSLLSGGEKSLVALGFLFAVFLARPCPFYILDEVEAALDDRNIDRFLALVRGYSKRSQFIVITHQRRTMEAADVLYGVSMGKDGISKVVSRKLGDGSPEQDEEAPAGGAEGEESLSEAA